MHHSLSLLIIVLCSYTIASPLTDGFLSEEQSFPVLVPRCSPSPKARQCFLEVDEMERTSPVILTNSSGDLNLAIPEQGIISLDTNEDIIFACPGPKNSFTSSTGSVKTATCTRDRKVRSGRTHVNFRNLQCENTVRGDAKETKEDCASGKGRIFEIGYQISRNQWITLIVVCYDKEQGNALYAEHTLYGKGINYRFRSKYRPNFSPQGLPRDIPADVAYKIAYQKSVLSKVLGSTKLVRKYICGRTSYMARGHLAPHADFIFPSWQYATYYYINVSPQWQAVNGGNWMRLEKSVRNFAEKVRKSLTVITGTYGILQLPDNRNVSKKIYLTLEKKIPVPKYTWKIVFDEMAKAAIVFIVLNNPFVQRITRSLYLCKSVCENSGWMEDYFENHKHGYIHCCKYNDFKKIVETAPELYARNLLRNDQGNARR